MTYDTPAHLTSRCQVSGLPAPVTRDFRLRRASGSDPVISFPGSGCHLQHLFRLWASIVAVGGPPHFHILSSCLQTSSEVECLLVGELGLREQSLLDRAVVDTADDSVSKHGLQRFSEVTPRGNSAQLSHKRCHRLSLSARATVEFETLNNLGRSRTEASVFTRLLYSTSPGFWGAIRLLSSLYVAGPMRVSSTARFFSSLSIPLATKKCPRRSSYCFHSSVALSNSSIFPNVAVILSEL